MNDRYKPWKSWPQSINDGDFYARQYARYRVRSKLDNVEYIRENRAVCEQADHIFAAAGRVCRGHLHSKSAISELNLARAGMRPAAYGLYSPPPRLTPTHRSDIASTPYGCAVGPARPIPPPTHGHEPESTRSRRHTVYKKTNEIIHKTKLCPPPLTQ
ncbi:hypothetical protein RR48_04362 [Papilio machaon]|uniref:Uncharacterized protein n=1 Tax=Papilio machaon TaxID=76193 RepID=A0A0N1IDF1_PAPMA|nr:hypothetical protein RR48_04362 [Papilio machaon]